MDVLLEDPAGRLLVHMALDTGATYTVVPTGTLRAIGYDPHRAAAYIEFIAAGSVERQPVITVRAAEAFGVRLPRLCRSSAMTCRRKVPCVDCWG